MKDSYPRSSILPFVLLGVGLFCLALTPPGWWNQLADGVLDYVSPGDQPERNEPPIVIFEREAPRPRAVITAAMVKGDRGSPQPSPGESDSKSESRQPTDRTSQPREGSAANRYVWEPPADWVPRPIQPMRIEPEPPVATRFIAKGSNDNRSSELVPEIDSSDTIIESPLSHSEQLDEISALEDIEPLRAPDPSDQPLKPASGVDEAGIPHTNVATNEPDSPVMHWPKVTQLHELLAPGADDPLLRQWIFEIRKTLAMLEGGPVTGGPEQLQHVDRLRQLSRLKVDKRGWPADQRRLYDRIRFAIDRRTEVWLPLLRVASQDSTLAQLDAHRELTATAQRLVGMLAGGDSNAWVEYLNLTRFRDAVENDPSFIPQLAEQTWQRMHSRSLSAEQREFLRYREFQRFEQQLLFQIAEGIRPSDVMSALEVYESKPSRENSAQIIGYLQRLRFGAESYGESIAAINSHYRNANLRVSVSEDLINRFVPAFHQYAEQVNDTILGAAVRGRNATSTSVSVRLVPDASSIRLGLIANGRVNSNTASRKGPVTMFNNAQSTFTAGKQLVVRPNGVFVSRTQTRASTGNRLVGLQTELDNVPILGWILRTLAEREQNEQRSVLRAEVLRRVKRSASQRIDREVHQRLANVEQGINRRVMQPLNRMKLDPRAMEMRTTEDRVIMRSRLASPIQLGAHTPRPQARSDNKMSFHIHQTALNNLIEQLELQSRRMSIEQLVGELSRQTGLELQLASDEHKDTILQFADLHPLELFFDDGQITLTIRLAELDTGKRKWKDFSVRGRYRADVQQLDVELIRDDGIELIGDRLGLGDQVALRGIFTKVLAKNTRFEMLRKAIADQPKLQDLVVTQFSVRDGWVAIALGDDADGVRFVQKTSGMRQ